VKCVDLTSIVNNKFPSSCVVCTTQVSLLGYPWFIIGTSMALYVNIFYDIQLECLSFWFPLKM